MNLQENEKIESPPEGKLASVIEQHNQQNNQIMFSSKITQKRKPMFYEAISQSQNYKSDSLEKSVSTKTQKSKPKTKGRHFSGLFQDQRLRDKLGDQQNHQEHDQYQLNENDSITSSSIQDDSGLAEVKRQLFPQTPIKTITTDTQSLYFKKQFASSTWKKELFEGEVPLPRPNISLNNNQIKNLSNQNIFLKNKVQKVKNILISLLQISKIENETTNSIINNQSTLK